LRVPDEIETAVLVVTRGERRIVPTDPGEYSSGGMGEGDTKLGGVFRED